MKIYLFVFIVLSGIIVASLYFMRMRMPAASARGPIQRYKPIGISLSSSISQATPKKNHARYTVRAVALNPIENQALESNSSKIHEYVKDIALLGANTISLYNCGLYDWDTVKNVASSKSFCEKVYLYAAQENLKVIAGYFSNTTQNWENPDTVLRATTQFKDLVNTTKNYSFIHYYLIGNEIFEKLPTPQAKNNYAKWIADMTVWLNRTAPEKEIIYADNVNLEALSYLQKYSAHINTYAINDYEWGSAEDLAKKIKEMQQKMPGSRVLLHEWGVDSFDVSTMQEDQAKQSVRIVYLAKEIEKVSAQFQGTFVGSSLFSFTDDLSKLGNPLSRDSDAGQSWVCTTCFDNKANEEYWGIYKKTAYESLRSYWNFLSKSN